MMVPQEIRRPGHRADIGGRETMELATEDAARLRAIVRSAIDLGVDSAVLFVAAPATNLELAARAADVIARSDVRDGATSLDPRVASALRVTCHGRRTVGA